MKEIKGITLVALIVTIIILLILAGVTISLTIGERGIITRAQQAGKNYVNAQEQEEDVLDNLDNEINTIISGIGGGSDGDGNGNTPPNNADLSISEKIEKLKETNLTAYCFHDGDEGTEKEYTVENHFNTIGKQLQLEPEAICECKKVKEIYLKAVEMGLVQTYEGGIMRDEENKYIGQGAIATITEPSLVYYDFEVFNSEQLLGNGSLIPAALNYELDLNLKGWIDGASPDASDNKNGGDFETALMWLGDEWRELGYTMYQARAKNYAGLPISDLGQVAHYKINVITQTNFKKALKALNLDLSSYKCIHPTTY